MNSVRRLAPLSPLLAVLACASSANRPSTAAPSAPSADPVAKAAGKQAPPEELPVEVPLPPASPCSPENAAGWVLEANALMVDVLTPSDRPRAVRLFARACEAGSWEGCVMEVLMHSDGIGTPKDPAKTLPIYLRGCEHGVVRACSSAGETLLEESDKQAGNESPMPQKVRELLERGCLGGDWGGCSKLARRAKDDMPRLMDVLTRACDKPFGWACGILAKVMEESGSAPAQVEAMNRKACELGYIMSCPEGSSNWPPAVHHARWREAVGPTVPYPAPAWNRASPATVELLQGAWWPDCATTTELIQDPDALLHSLNRSDNRRKCERETHGRQLIFSGKLLTLRTVTPHGDELSPPSALSLNGETLRLAAPLGEQWKVRMSREHLIVDDGTAQRAYRRMCTAKPK